MPRPERPQPLTDEQFNTRAGGPPPLSDEQFNTRFNGPSPAQPQRPNMGMTARLLPGGLREVRSNKYGWTETWDGDNMIGIRHDDGGPLKGLFSGMGKGPPPMPEMAGNGPGGLLGLLSKLFG